MSENQVTLVRAVDSAGELRSFSLRDGSELLLALSGEQSTFVCDAEIGRWAVEDYPEHIAIQEG